jgi:quercetin dioxygenase-like cupin family protein
MKEDPMERTYVQHANDSTFRLVEPGIFVRDLGVGALTHGELTAQVVRIEPEGACVENLHRHDEGFSLAYVLKGWLDVEFEEIGVQHLGLGTVIPAYNGPMHRELASGDGFELLLLVTRKSVSENDRQRIVVQQERDAPYAAGAGGMLVRDFGLRPMTAGRLTARAIKATPGKRADAPMPAHDGETRFLYVVDGWIELAYEDIGSVRLEKGAASYEPRTAPRAHVAHGDDLALVEVSTSIDWTQ